MTSRTTLDSFLRFAKVHPQRAKRKWTFEAACIFGLNLFANRANISRRLSYQLANYSITCLRSVTRPQFATRTKEMPCENQRPLEVIGGEIMQSDSFVSDNATRPFSTSFPITRAPVVRCIRPIIPLRYVISRCVCRKWPALSNRSPFT